MKLVSRVIKILLKVNDKIDRLVLEPGSMTFPILPLYLIMYFLFLLFVLYCSNKKKQLIKVFYICLQGNTSVDKTNVHVCPCMKRERKNLDACIVCTRTNHIKYLHLSPLIFFIFIISLIK